MTLTQSRLIRCLTFFCLYFTQGLIIGLYTIALPAWFAKHDVSTAQISSFIAISTLPWSLKLIAGAMMDRFTYLPMGRRRPWVLIAQTGTIICFIILSLQTSPLSNITLLTTLFFITNACAALQDVAVDGLAIDTVPPEERSQINAFMFGGQIIGSAAAAAIASNLLNTTNFQTTMLSIASFMIIIILLPLILRERPGEKHLPWTQGAPSDHALKSQLHNWKTIIINLLKSLITPISILAIITILLFRISDGIIGTLLPIITVKDLGWSDTEYSQYSALIGLIAGLIGIIFGSTLAKRLGTRKTLIIVTIGLMLCSLIAAYFPEYWSQKTYVKTFLFLTQVFSLLAIITFIALFMNICQEKVAASQFTLYMALANLGFSAGAALFGTLSESITLQTIIYLSAALLIPVTLLIPYLKNSKST